MAFEAHPGELRDTLQRAGLFEQMGRTRHDLELDLAAHLLHGIAVHPDHGRNETADDEQRRRGDLRERRAGEIGPAAA